MARAGTPGSPGGLEVDATLQEAPPGSPAVMPHLTLPPPGLQWPGLHTLIWRPAWKDVGRKSTAPLSSEQTPCLRLSKAPCRQRLPLHSVLHLLPGTEKERAIWGAERVLGALGCRPLSVSCCRGLPERSHVWSDWGRGGRAHALGIWPAGQQCLHYFPTSLRSNGPWGGGLGSGPTSGSRCRAVGPAGEARAGLCVGAETRGVSGSTRRPFLCPSPPH